ncbi:DUF5354 domain-containing protein [Caenorhabditis elegans]|uniref:Uncharacterized protein C02B8.3 n=1 Tax=Caenorhabditis elegans TaxID=6239 RepID=YWZ3_CAEEL|nr:Uncharacterized protein CELE_C02B8.3 [Caenorhabditis elegans]Q11093.1 RecName: Full=Uncharacterized protein C02B8.3 [Caenorhabditis elegans]CCD62505.1 Uncharacterized protein CELE_C02B8.3 [Caenorhabditis elegans]|eukprot:NP_509371.1 Uncharacterized protein CELE_C02B8.3 [Caenorhabditis elegans]
MNAVQDAQDQLTKLIRCWEPIDSDDLSKGHTMSDPVYQLCSYMPSPKDYNKFHVNGVQMDSDDYTTILTMFANQLPGYAVLNVCLQEAFQFHKANHPSQVSLRCLCQRDGCNLPKTLTDFLDFNKGPIPAVNF